MTCFRRSPRKLAGTLVIAAAALVLTGCQPDKAVSITNSSGKTLTIQFETADGPKDVATLKPGGGTSIALSWEDQQNKCTNDGRHRAVDESGAVIAEMGKICSGDTWDIK